MPPKNNVPKNANTSTVTTLDTTAALAPEPTQTVSVQEVKPVESAPVKKSRKAPVSKLTPPVASEQTVSSAQPTDDKSAQPTNDTPVQATNDTPVQAGGKKTAKRTATKQTAGQVVAPASDVSQPVVSQDAGVVTKQKRAPRKTATTTSTAPVTTTSATTENEQTAGDVTTDEKQIRSFKVQLPGSENFEGRFTGLTPYQAANKALSKYFREGERDNAEVTFSICESTRKSKKSVYTYVGQRHRLDEPVKYTIQDGREIVKNFKNTLKKVKKSATTAVAAPAPVSA